MNKLGGRIANIQVSEGMSLVKVQVTEQLALKAIVLETPESAAFLKEGNPVNLLFKETEVVIGTMDDHAISLQNRIPGTVKSIERGKLISKVTMLSEVGEIISVISTNAVQQLKLEEQISIIAMIKLNEMMLSE